MKNRSSKKKPAAKTKKLIKKRVKKTATKPKKAKASAKGMNDFQQCVVLAAIINHKRNTDPKFLFVPLPDINSSALAPVRELLGQYEFTATDIVDAIKDILASKAFKQCFPAESGPMKATLFALSKNQPKEIMAELLDLAGPESKKTIYLRENDIHDIHKTTLEKHALKLGLVDPQPFMESNIPIHEAHLARRQILIKLSSNKLDKSFGGNFSRFSTKQRRGRG